jgi:hypothetical protein
MDEDPFLVDRLTKYPYAHGHIPVPQLPLEFKLIIISRRLVSALRSMPTDRAVRRFSYGRTLPRRQGRSDRSARGSDFPRRKNPPA